MILQLKWKLVKSHQQDSFAKAVLMSLFDDLIYRLKQSDFQRPRVCIILSGTPAELAVVAAPERNECPENCFSLNPSDIIMVLSWDMKTSRVKGSPKSSMKRESFGFALCVLRKSINLYKSLYGQIKLSILNSEIGVPRLNKSVFWRF